MQHCTDTPSPPSKPSYGFSGRKSSWSISHRCHTWTSSQSHGWACAGQGTIVSSSQTVFHKPELRAMSMCGEKFFWQLFWWCFVIGHLTSEERFVVFHLLVNLIIWLMAFPAIFRLERPITATEKKWCFWQYSEHLNTSRTSWVVKSNNPLSLVWSKWGSPE